MYWRELVFRFLFHRENYALVRSRQGLGDGGQRETEALPLVVAAAQGASALDAELLQSGCSFYGGGVAGAAGAVENYIAVAGNFMAALGEDLGCDVQRAGQGEGFISQIVRVAQIDDENIFAFIEPAL